MKIDSHNHFWIYREEEYEWISDDMESIKKDFLPEQFSPLIKENGFEGTILVQARQTLSETEWLLKLAKQFPFIKGVVGWVDLCSSQLEGQLESLRNESLLKGVRHVLQGESDEFILSDEFNLGISYLEKYNLTYDILIGHKQLPAAINLVSKFPRQKFVLDHIGKPNIKDANVEEWKRNIQKLALNKNVYCKLSGMVTEANWYKWKKDDFNEYLDTVFNSFGVERLMIGSDWPVCTVSSSYSNVMGIVKKYISNLSHEDQRKIMGLNCLEFYNIKY